MEPTAGERPHTTPRLLPVTVAANGRDCEGLKLATAGVTTTESVGGAAAVCPGVLKKMPLNTALPAYAVFVIRNET
jgi:hypothetical protein